MRYNLILISICCFVTLKNLWHFRFSWWRVWRLEPSGMLNRVLDVVHVDGVRLCLWTSATNSPTVHYAGDIWAWRAMVEWYCQGETEEPGEVSQWHFFHHKSHMDWPGPPPEPWHGQVLDVSENYFSKWTMFLSAAYSKMRVTQKTHVSTQNRWLRKPSTYTQGSPV
jgi:hypothetical protein